MTLAFEKCLFVSYRSHVTLFEPPGFSGVDESSSYRTHSQTVAAVLPASEMLFGRTDRKIDLNKVTIITAVNIRLG